MQRIVQAAVDVDSIVTGQNDSPVAEAGCVRQEAVLACPSASNAKIATAEPHVASVQAFTTQ